MTKKKHVFCAAITYYWYLILIYKFVINRRKLQNQIKELEEALSAAESKCSSVEKTKNRLATELEDVNLDLEKVRQYLIQLSLNV